jgi:hypothetical protein
LYLTILAGCFVARHTKRPASKGPPIIGMATKDAATNGPGYERSVVTRSGHAQKTKGNGQRTGDKGTADERQGTEPWDTGTEDGRQGTETYDWGQRMGDRGQIK